MNYKEATEALKEIQGIDYFTKQHVVTGDYRRHRRELASTFTHVVNFDPKHVYTAIQQKSDTLFDSSEQSDTKTKRVKSPELRRWISAVGKISKGSTHGRFFLLDATTTHHEFHVTNTQDFWRRVAVTTGSTDFVFKNLILRWYNMGWVEVEDGLYRKDQCDYTILNGKFIYIKDGSFKDYERPPVWESEEHFFDWLGLNYVKPEDRT